MAAQCWLRGPPASLLHHPHHHHNNNHHQQPSQQTFISSNAYYGYVPVNRNNDTVAAAAAANETPANLDTTTGGMDVDVEEDCRLQAQKMMFTEDDRCRARKRCLAQDDLPAYQQGFKRFREEAVVTNAFSMVQESSSNNISSSFVTGKPTMMSNTADWPRCTMRRYYA